MASKKTAKAAPAKVALAPKAKPAKAAGKPVAPPAHGAPAYGYGAAPARQEQ